MQEAGERKWGKGLIGEREMEREGERREGDDGDREGRRGERTDGKGNGRKDEGLKRGGEGKGEGGREKTRRVEKGRRKRKQTNGGSSEEEDVRKIIKAMIVLESERGKREQQSSHTAPQTASPMDVDSRQH